MGPGDISIAIQGADVGVKNNRSAALFSLFKKKTLTQTYALMPLVLSLCPAAHMACLQTAQRCLQGEKNTLVNHPLVQIEALLETLRFFTLDVRKILGLNVAEESLTRPLGALRARLFNALKGKEDLTLYADTVAYAASWLTKEEGLRASLFQALKSLTDFTVSKKTLLSQRDLTALAVLQGLYCEIKKSAAFAFCPCLNGFRVTGALARKGATSNEVALGFLWDARLEEIKALSEGKETLLGKTSAFEIGDNTVAVVTETARGVLIYFVRLAGDLIEDIAWIAPTEWTFQNDGVMVDLLKKASARGLGQKEAELIVAAFDACTSVSVRKD